MRRRATGIGADGRRGVARGLLLGALALALGGQYLLTGEILLRREAIRSWGGHHVTGALLLVAATGAAFLFGRRSRWALGPAAPAAEEVRHGIPRTARPFVAAAAAAWAVALAAYVARGESLLCLGAWAASILLLVVPLLRAPGPRGFGTTPVERVAVGALTLVAFGLRHWRLTELPSAVHVDVPFMGDHTLALLDGNGAEWFGIAPSEHLFTLHRVLGLGMELFGRDQYGLVILGVLAGTLTVPVTYLLGRELFGRLAGWLAAGLLAVSYTHIHFSRTLFGPKATFLVALSALLLLRALRLGGAHRWALSGVLSAFAVFNYDSGRVGPLVVAALAVWLLVRDRAEFRRTLPGWAAWALGLVVAFGPMLAYAVRDPGGFAGRANVVVLWDELTYEHSLKKYDADGWMELLAGQTRQALLAFHSEPDQSPHFTLRAPGLSPAAAALLVVGAGLALSGRAGPRAALLIAWIGLTLLLGAILTSDPPFWPHLNILLPPVCLLAGLAFAELVAAFSGSGRVATACGTVLATLGVAAMGTANWSFYRESFADNAETWLRIARAVRPYPAGTPVLLVSDDLKADHVGFQFFCRRQPFEDVAPEALAGRLEALVGPAVVVLESHPELAAEVLRSHPEGRSETVSRQGGEGVPVTVVRVGGVAPVAGGDVPAQRWRGWLTLALVAAVWVALRAVALGRSVRRAGAAAPEVTPARTGEQPG